MPYLIPPPESPTQPSPVAEHVRCEVRFSGPATAWINPRGRLDLAAAPQFEQALKEAFSSALLVIVDLRELTFIDSTGLHVLIEAEARARRSRRRFVLGRGAAQIDHLFQLVGLSDRLEIIDLKPVLVSFPAHPAPAPPTVA